MVICGDDYGLSADVNEAILDLVDRSKLTAVSCLVAAPGVSRSALAALVARDRAIDVGLHLAMTPECVPACASDLPTLAPGGHFLNFNRLLPRCFLGKVDPAEVHEEIEAQCRLFQELAGRAPDFLDSHLHIHQFPVIREAVIDWVLSLPENRRPYVRSSYMPLARILRQRVSILKTLIVSWSGRRFRDRMLWHGLATNTSFSGIYGYRNWRKYPSYLARFVAHSKQADSLLAVHPGKLEPWRRMEYEALLRLTVPDGRINRFGPRLR